MEVMILFKMAVHLFSWIGFLLFTPDIKGQQTSFGDGAGITHMYIFTYVNNSGPLREFMTERVSDGNRNIQTQLESDLTKLLEELPCCNSDKSVVDVRFEPNGKTSHKVVVTVRMVFKSTERKRNAKDILPDLSVVFLKPFLSRYLDKTQVHSVEYIPESSPWCYSRTTNVPKSTVNVVWRQVPDPLYFNALCLIPGEFDPSKYAVRQCFGGKWSTIDYSRCIHRLPSISMNIRPSNMMEVSKQVLNFIRFRSTDTTFRLTQEDVQDISGLLKKLLMISPSNDSALDPSVGKNILQSVYTLIQCCTELMCPILSRYTEIIQKVLRTIEMGKNGYFSLQTNNAAFLTLSLSGPSSPLINKRNAKNLVIQETTSPDDRVGEIKFYTSNETVVGGLSLTSVVVPMESLVIDDTTEGTSLGLRRIAVVVYKQAKILEGSLHTSDRVISVMLTDSNRIGFQGKLRLSFLHNVSTYSPRCLSLEQKQEHCPLGKWKTAGCELISTTPHVSTCECDSIPYFTLETARDKTENRKLPCSVIKIVGYNVLVLFLASTVLYLTKHRSPHWTVTSKMVVNFSVALSAVTLLFIVMVVNDATEFMDEIGCKIVAMLLHYFLLSSLSWIALYSYYPYMALVYEFRIYYKKVWLKLFLFGWGLPCLVVFPTIATFYTRSYGFVNEEFCWIRAPAVYVTVAVPIGFVFIFNYYIIYRVTLMLIQAPRRKLQQMQDYHVNKSLNGSFVITTLLVLSWQFAFMGRYLHDLSVCIFSTFFNIALGVFVFLFYSVFKGQVCLWSRLVSWPPYVVQATSGFGLFLQYLFGNLRYSVHWIRPHGTSLW